MLTKGIQGCRVFEGPFSGLFCMYTAMQLA